MFTQLLKSSIKQAKNAESVFKIIENKIKKNQLAPSKTLILVDLDLTVFDRTPNIMSDLNPGERKKFLDDLAQEDHGLIEIAYAGAPYSLVENSMITALNQFIDDGFTVLGFTSRRTGKAKAVAETNVEDDACKSIQQLAVKFSSIPAKEFVISADSIQLENPHLRAYEVIGNPMIYGDQYEASTIFTANYPKGFILNHVIDYLSTLGIEIDNVIEIDDNPKYLDDLKNACQTMNLNFIGLHYTYAHDNKPQLDPSIVEIQKKTLIEEKRLITDDEAITIKNRIALGMDR